MRIVLESMLLSIGIMIPFMLMCVIFHYYERKDYRKEINVRSEMEKEDIENFYRRRWNRIAMKTRAKKKEIDEKKKKIKKARKKND